MTEQRRLELEQYHDDIIKLLDIPDNLIDDARQECWVSTLQGNNTTEHMKKWLKAEKKHQYHND